MKVFLNNTIEDKAIDRIADALRKYIPEGMELVQSEDEAELVIIYAFGLRRGVKHHTERLLKAGKKYAIVQICIRNTPNPKTEDWLPIWQKAQLVWSYFDLNRYCVEDGNLGNFNFYFAPLGVNSEIFQQTGELKDYIVASSGHGFSRESMREIVLAAREVNRRVFHIGQAMEVGRDIDYSNGMSDADLAKSLSRCSFVAGLRRTEGFELPVIEGLLCGARPICFDKPHYRTWFASLPEYIPEGTDEEVIQSLVKIFKEPVRPVTKDEKDYVKAFFNWKAVAEGFWRKLI